MPVTYRHPCLSGRSRGLRAFFTAYVRFIAVVQTNKRVLFLSLNKGGKGYAGPACLLIVEEVFRESHKVRNRPGRQSSFVVVGHRRPVGEAPARYAP